MNVLKRVLKPRLAFGLTAMLASVSTLSATKAAIITQWSFDSVPNDATTSTGTNTPSIGTGTVTLVGGTTSTYAAGSPSDPDTTDNSGLNLTNFAAQSTNNDKAGVEFATSTVGSGGPISLSFDFRQSGTASRDFQLLVSSDGTTFTAPSGGTTSFGTTAGTNTLTSFSNTGFYVNNAGGGTQNFVQAITYTFPAGSVYENDPNFAFEFVAAFDPGTGGGTQYISSNAGTTANYGTSGTARFDEVTVSVPEPTSLTFVGVISAALLGRRRRAI